VDDQVKLPQTSYEQRVKLLYKDMGDLISPGFLTTDIEISEVRLSFRSFLPRDIYFLLRRSSIKNQEWMKWVIAHSTWMVDGFSIMEDVNAPVYIYEYLSNLGPPAIKKLFYIQSLMTKRMEESIDLIKFYSMESVSRQIWKQNNGVPLNSPLITGIPGTEHLGLNIIQRMWTIYNHYQDKADSSREAWSNSKFVASSMNPKGVKKLEDREKAREGREEEVKQEKLDRAFYQKMGLVKDDGTLGDGRKLFNLVKSVDDLVSEYKNWVDGNLDEHDKVIMKYKESLREKYEADEARYSNRKIELSDDDSDQKIVSLDMDQMRKLMAERETNPNLVKVYEGDSMSKSIYGKHIKSDTSSIPNTSMGDSLQEKIKARNPRFNKK